VTCYYWSPPSEQELAKYGGIKTAEDFPEPDIDVWEENWEALQLYIRNQSQWRAGPRGIIGLDYNVIYTDMTLREIPMHTQNELMDNLRIIEGQARKELSNPA
jgi:hypothetical protein